MNIGSVKMNTCLIMTRECITFLYSPLCSVDYPRVSWQVTGWLRWQHRKHQHPIFHNRDGDGCEYTQNIVHWVCTRCIAALHSEPCRRKVLSTQCAVRGGAFRVVCLGLSGVVPDNKVRHLMGMSLQPDTRELTLPFPPHCNVLNSAAHCQLLNKGSVSI